MHGNIWSAGTSLYIRVQEALSAAAVPQSLEVTEMLSFFSPTQYFLDLGSFSGEKKTKFVVLMICKLSFDAEIQALLG